MISIDNLILALFYEHKQRTGHDSTRRGPDGFYPHTNITCDVCLWLDKLMKQAEEMQYPLEPSTESAKEAHDG